MSYLRKLDRQKEFVEIVVAVITSLVSPSVFLSDTSASSEGFEHRLPTAEQFIYSICLPYVSNQGFEENENPAMCSAARETPQAFDICETLGTQ